MAAYIIYETTITDTAWRAEYGEKVGPLIAKYGGKLLIKDTEAQRIEGSRSLPTVVVVLEFPSHDAANAWHNDIEYQPLLELRNSGSTAEALLVKGI